MYLTRLLAGIGVFALTSTIAPAAPATHVLHGSAPPWANSQNFAGAADPGGNVGFRIYLGWINPTAAESLAKAVSDPSNAAYGHYLSPQQFRARFSPAASDVACIKNWLKSQGFTVEYTPLNGHYVSAEGTVAQAQAAFGVQFANYRVRGVTVRSPNGDVSVPATIAPLISGIVGLDDSYMFVHTNHIVDAPPVGGFRNAPPLSAYWAQQLSPYAYPAGFTALANPRTVPWTVKGYTPDQIKGAYGISGYDGAGQTVAIIDAYASPTILSDVNQWSMNRGLPTMNPGQLVQVVPPGVYNRAQTKQQPPKQDPQGWSTEETLDVEAVHGMAP